MPATTTNERLKAWVDEWAGVLEPDAIHWCDGSAEEYDRLAAELVAAGTFTRLDEAKRPNSYWAHSDPGDVARVEDRTFICSATEEAAGPNNNWREPDEMRAELTDALPGIDEGPHHVRGAVLDGPARFADRPHRRAADRLRVRGREHADHDPHGAGGPGRARRRGVGALPALGRRAARRGRGRRAVAVQPGQQVHRPLPRDPRDLELRLRLRRQRAARQEVLRPAHRLGHGSRRRLAGRAHAHPQADQPRERRARTSRRRSRRPAARPTWPCSSRPSRAGRSRPSATTSAG